MTAEKNRQILLASRPRGEPTRDNFKLIEADIPEPGRSQMLLRTILRSSQRNIHSPHNILTTISIKFLSGLSISPRSWVITQHTYLTDI